MIKNLEAIKAAIDIVDVVSQHVNLNKKGKNQTGLCPFHSENTPSFNVSQSGQFFKCFGCGKSGDVFKFQQETNNQTFREAVEALAKRQNIQLENDQNFEVNESDHHRRESLFVANAVVHDFLLANDFSKKENGLVDLDGRKFSEKTLAHFGVSTLPNRNLLAENVEKLQLDLPTLETLGLLKKSEQGAVYDFFKNRILFPIRNVNGKLAGFAGRKRGDAPAKTAKYLNSPESEIFKKSELLFGLHENREAIRENKTAILVEGYFDCLSVWQTGRKNVVASCGTAVNEAHARLLSRFAEKIILLFDGDTAGQKATEKSWRLLEKQGLFVQICQLPTGEDPDSFIRQHGGAAFEKLFAEQTCDAVIWFAKNQIANAGSDSLAQHQLSETIAEYLKTTKFTALREKWAAGIAQITGLTLHPKFLETEKAAPSTASDAPNFENLGNGLLKKGNCYFLKKGKKEQQVSNFVLHPKFCLHSKTETTRVFEAENVDGQKVTTVFDNQTLSTEINAGVFITGQDFPSADPALLTRTILLPFSKSTFSSAEQQSFLNLKKMQEAGGLSWITSDMARHANFFQSQFAGELSRLRNSLARTVNEQFSGEVVDRLLANYAILLTTCFTLQEKLGLPNWFLQKLEIAVVKALIAHCQSLNQSDDLSKFWDAFEQLTDRNGLVFESDWTLETPSTVTLKSKDGKPSVFKNEAGEKLLFLRLKSVHAAYSEYSRRVFGQDALSKTTLEHYLKNSPTFLGNVDNWRFGEKITSGMVFRYASLGIDLKVKKAF